MRAVQAYLVALADGEIPPPMSAEPPDLAAFVASLSSAWHAGEIRPTFSIAAKPRYLRSLQKVSAPVRVARPATAPPPETPPVRDRTQPEQPGPVYAGCGHARVQALRMVWPIMCRRLEGLPNINAMQLFEALYLPFPGRFTRKQVHNTAPTRPSLA